MDFSEEQRIFKEIYDILFNTDFLKQFKYEFFFFTTNLVNLISNFDMVNKYMWHIIKSEIIISKNFKFIRAYTETQNQSDCNEVIDLLKYVLNNS